jgi:hypothetical protein
MWRILILPNSLELREFLFGKIFFYASILIRKVFDRKSFKDGPMFIVRGTWECLVFIFWVFLIILAGLMPESKEVKIKISF